VEKEMYTFDDRGSNSITLKQKALPRFAGLSGAWFSILRSRLNSINFSPISATKGRRRAGSANTISSDVKPSGKRMHFLMPKLSTWPGNSEIAGFKKIRCFLSTVSAVRNAGPKYLEVLRGYFANHIGELCPDCRTRLDRNVLRLLDCKQPGCQQIVNQAPKSIDYLCLPCADHFQQLKNYLGILEIPFEVNQRLVRGLDYYSRTVFEIQPRKKNRRATIVGGGRYDGLIEMLGGKPTPAIGFATGIGKNCFKPEAAKHPGSSGAGAKDFCRLSRRSCPE